MADRYTCVLLTTDRPDLAAAAEAYARSKFDVRHVSRHARRERDFPRDVSQTIERGDIDILLNYLAPMIVPGRVLRQVRREAINFHPAPPAWPGIGSASYALYRGDTAFGATAHRMTTAIDAGEIVRVVTFPVAAADGCDSLFDRALTSTLQLFRDVCDDLARDGRLQPSGEVWERAAVTRAEFERWMTLSSDDTQEEVVRKVRALRHPQYPGPFYEINGMRVPHPEHRAHLGGGGSGGAKPIVSTQTRLRHPEHFEIGDYSIVDDFCYMSTRVRIGTCSHIANGCSIAGGPTHQFTLGDFCSLSSGVKVWCASDDFVNDIVCILPPGVGPVKRGFIEGDVTFGDYTAVGSNSVVMPGNHIPEGTVIGALSFVPTRFAFEPWSVYAGIPIRRTGARNRAAVLEQAAILRTHIASERDAVPEP